MATVSASGLPPNPAAGDGLSRWLTLTPVPHNAETHGQPVDKLGFGHSRSLSPLTLMAMEIKVLPAVLCHPSHLRLRMFLKVPASHCSLFQCISRV